MNFRSGRSASLYQLAALAVGCAVSFAFGATASPATNAPTSTVGGVPPHGADLAAEPRTTNTPATALEAAFNRLRGATTPAGAAPALEALKEHLSRIPLADASAAVRRFLDSGQNVPTGLGFVIRSDGSLAQSPTLRVFALNWLTAMDPRAAAEAGRCVLQTKTSPDEWAASLRACARWDKSPETLRFLREKTRELALHKPWQTNPSTAYLEAFDLFVHTRDTEFTPELCGFLRIRENPALSHAAFVALDRLVLAAPAATLRIMLDRTALLAGREAARAGFFARADLRDPAQKELLAAYLLSPFVAASELNAFAGIFPNGNFMISNNLVTPASPPTGGWRIRDKAAFAAVNQWLRDDKFQKVRPELDLIRARLASFVQTPD